MNAKSQRRELVGGAGPTVAPAAAVTPAEVAAGGARGSWLGRHAPHLFLAYLLLYPLPWLFEPPGTLDLVASAAGIAVFVPVYLYAWSQSGARLLVGAAAILGIGFALQPFGGVWGMFGVYAAALVAYVRPRRLAIAALLSVLAIVIAYSLLRGLHLGEWIMTVFFGALVGLGSLHQASVEYANRELEQSREEARRLAAVAERERIARDLHDVLGHTLTVVAVKADLAAKLVGRDAEAARREIEDIRATARAALAEVRSAVTGMRTASLGQELTGAERALASAGVATDVAAPPVEPLPPAVESALAWVLREAVTNVVRHADASRCRILLERDAHEVRLEVHDDGRGAARAEGNGIAGMRDRLRPLGGELCVESRGGTRVLARVPVGVP